MSLTAWDTTRLVAFSAFLALACSLYLSLALSYVVYSRSNLFLRVRYPRVMLTDLLVSLFCVTLVCLREIFDARQLALPCGLTNIGFVAYLCDASLIIHVRCLQLHTLQLKNDDAARTSSRASDAHRSDNCELLKVT